MLRARAKRLIAGAVVTAVVIVGGLAVTAGPAAAVEPSDWFGSLSSASPANRTWMSAIPDDTSLARMSIPGTHDSLALCGYNSGDDISKCEAITTNITRTQEPGNGWGRPTLLAQLNAGIRALDIRVRVDQSSAGLTFTIHHGVYYQHANFDDVLGALRDFLAAHPGETVLLNLKAECGGGTTSCTDAVGFDTDAWRQKIFDSYLTGQRLSGDSSPAKPGTNYSSLFWTPSATGQTAVPTLGQVRGKVVLTAFRSPSGGAYSKYGFAQLWSNNSEYVQDNYDVSSLGAIANKWEQVRAHLRRTNGVWDTTRPGEREYRYQPDAIYLNNTNGSSSTGVPIPADIAGGVPGSVTGVNEFFYDCLLNQNGRCPEFYPGRPDNFGGQTTMTRTGMVLMDFPGGKLIDQIIAHNQPSSPSPQLRIMPLGDSITYGIGSSTGESYRADLWNDLRADGQQVDFVGSQNSGTAAGVDNDNEGHSGWVISQIAGITSCVIQQYRPNVVTLHIGTNDLNTGQQSGATDRLGGLIDQIVAKAPDATVLVATLVPSRIAGTEANIKAYNAALPGVVRPRQAAGDHVRLVDMSAVTTGDLSDDLHPNDGGYAKMATAFNAAIGDSVLAGWIHDPVSGNPGACGGTGTGGAPVAPADGDIDLNGDGLADYLALNDNGGVHAWINTGGDRPAVPGWASDGQVGNGAGATDSHVQIADVDGDHRADFLIVNDDGSVHAYLNRGGDGHGGWEDRGIFASGAGSPGSAVRFADWDGDGKADYLTVGTNGSVHVWLNRGGDTATTKGWIDWGQVASGTGPADHIRFADIDGDGKADYVTIADNGAATAWLNRGGDGHGGWTVRRQLATGVGVPGSQVRLADFDSDGHADYLTVAPNAVLHAWLYRGGDIPAQPGWTDHGPVASGVATPDRIRFGDVNGDGLTDYLVVGADGSVQAWLNAGGDHDGVPGWTSIGTVITGFGAPGSEVRFADLNGDGHDDYLAVAPDGTVQAWLNPGGDGRGSWTALGQIANGAGFTDRQIRFADIDGDGRADFLGVSDNGAVHAYVNHGGDGHGGWTDRGQIGGGVGVPGSQIRFADINGDGKADYLAVADNGSIHAWINIGGDSGGKPGWIDRGQIAGGVGTPAGLIRI